jgi:hypothetical protein
METSSFSFAVAFHDLLADRERMGVEDIDVVVELFLDRGPILEGLGDGMLRSTKSIAMGSWGPWEADCRPRCLNH